MKTTTRTTMTMTLRTSQKAAGLLAAVALTGLWTLAATPARADVKKDPHPVGIDRDKDVIHLADFIKEPVVLTVDKAAPVFSDKGGVTKLGTLQANQKVVVEAMTARAYKVRGKGETDGIAGWVGPKYFSSQNPDFEKNLLKFYERQVMVSDLISQQKVAVGMTPDEVNQSLGKPTKTDLKQTAQGSSGRWDYIKYEDVPQYGLVRDPASGQVFRQVIGVTREEKSKTSVEFAAGVVSAVEESEQKHSSGAGLILPPVVVVR